MPASRDQYCNCFVRPGQPASGSRDSTASEGNTNERDARIATPRPVDGDRTRARAPSPLIGIAEEQRGRQTERTADGRTDDIVRAGTEADEQRAARAGRTRRIRESEKQSVFDDEATQPSVFNDNRRTDHEFFPEDISKLSPYQSNLDEHNLEVISTGHKRVANCRSNGLLHHGSSSEIGGESCRDK